MNKITTGFVALLATAALLLTGCAGATSVSDNSSRTVRFALDWTPNTNHTGLYVAQEKGYFAAEGIKVELIDYNSVLPDTLIDAGHADAGISFHDASVMAQASGAQVVAIMSVLQDWASAIAIRADDPSITRPADLDGKTYAGFGEPAELPLLTQVIRNDGGTGSFENVVLGTSAYEALYSGNADFTIPFFAWEGVEAERSGNPLRLFHYTDYGFPQQYAVVIDAGREWLSQAPEDAAAFVRALNKGYQFAAENPDEAADILIAANPGFFDDEEMVHESQRILSRELLRDANNQIGTLEKEHWEGYARFLFENGLLSDDTGKVLTEEPDWSTYYTTEYLPPRDAS
ncbi:ABC transporter substrate-binding protein [Lysinibacter sp. HNR]|uniref:ABC transporter substrate-binding protein n=1 Tax=Lysinibacter sp. HNR TaxID=3031408 RepID=UPI0024358BAE|nr:ABC transporter substrate-binding protein [Lysinibacter sp. HNR]WGD36454.1 ABC transporter substrate-binding protein [Lysinibacter sp. HNR]